MTKVLRYDAQRDANEKETEQAPQSPGKPDADITGLHTSNKNK